MKSLFLNTEETMPGARQWKILSAISRHGTITRKPRAWALFLHRDVITEGKPAARGLCRYMKGTVFLWGAAVVYRRESSSRMNRSISSLMRTTCRTNIWFKTFGLDCFLQMNLQFWIKASVEYKPTKRRRWAWAFQKLLIEWPHCCRKWSRTQSSYCVSAWTDWTLFMYMSAERKRRAATAALKQLPAICTNKLGKTLQTKHSIPVFIASQALEMLWKHLPTTEAPEYLSHLSTSGASICRYRQKMKKERDVWDASRGRWLVGTWEMGTDDITPSPGLNSTLSAVYVLKI